MYIHDATEQAYKNGYEAGANKVRAESAEYEKYLMGCLFSHTDYFTEEKILSFEEFQERDGDSK